VNQMKVSIALCTANGQTFLREQLDSYLSQTRAPDELVVCDDVSTDETVVILQEFARSAPFPVRIYRNENQLGYVKNFERAVLLCNGDIIFFSDQDDVWHPEKIELMATALEESPSLGVVFCDAEIVDSSLQSTGRTLWEMFRFSKRLQTRVIKGRATDVLIKMDLFWGLTVAFRSKYKNKLIPFFPGTGHDTWTAVLVAFLSDISIVQKPLVKYRQHSQNVFGVKGKALSTVLTSTVVKQRRGTRLKSFTNRAKQFEAIRERLVQIHDVPDLENKVRLLDEKIDHLISRGKMSSTRVLRVPQVLKELVTLRYDRYSRGSRDLIKDLLERDSIV
jgi:glycosyltransferase involved in cell wall biosynthesis